MSPLLIVIACLGLVGVIALVFAATQKPDEYREKAPSRRAENVVFFAIVLVLVTTIVAGLNWDRLQRAIPALRDDDYNQYPMPSGRTGTGTTADLQLPQSQQHV